MERDDDYGPSADLDAYRARPVHDVGSGDGEELAGKEEAPQHEAEGLPLASL